jgi:hypothetical protein
VHSQSIRFGLVLAAVTVAAVASCKQGPAPIPPPSPENTDPDQPGAAERAMVGSRTLGRPSIPQPAPGATAEQEAAGLAVTNSIADAKRVAAAHSAAAHGARPPPVPAGGAAARLVFAASTAGQLVPCGCSPDQRGGLPRAAALLAQLRTESPGTQFIDAGDLLFARAARPEGPAALQAEVKARTLARGAQLLGAAARIVGARDLALGEKFVAQNADGVPLVAAGAAFDGSQDNVILQAGTPPVAIGLVAFSSPEPDAAKALAARVAAVRKAGARLVIAVLHPAGDRAVQGAQALLPALQEAGVDLAVLGHRDDPGLDPDVVQAGQSGPPLLGPEGHGQTLLVLDLVLPAPSGAREKLVLSRGDEGKRDELAAIDQRLTLLRERAASADPALAPQLAQKVAELEQRRRAVEEAQESPPAGAVVATARFLKLNGAIPSDATAAKLVARYDAAVAEQNLAAAKKLPEACPPAAPGEPSFVGVTAPLKKGKGKGQGTGKESPDSCAACHPDEVKFWARTVHSRAYAALEQVNKQHSLDCVACHVTGWQQPGGVCRIDKTASGGPGLDAPAVRIGNGGSVPLSERLGVGRQGVQCEACHGPASEHVRISADLPKEVPVSTCTRCHEAENSPHFDYGRYLPWVVGPGHGEALPKGQEPRSRGEIAAGNTLGPNPALHAAPAKEQRP